jgi:DNA repair protein RadC
MNIEHLKAVFGVAEPLTNYKTMDEALCAPDLAPEWKARVVAFYELAVALTESRVQDRDSLSSWSDLTRYLHTALAWHTREQFDVLFLDRKNRLMRRETMGHGTIDHAPVYPREVVRRALELGACALILAHNHPSGDPSPSTADVDMTRLIVEAARLFEIPVHDHVVIGRTGHASMRQLGLMP